MFVCGVNKKVDDIVQQRVMEMICGVYEDGDGILDARVIVMI